MDDNQILRPKDRLTGDDINDLERVGKIIGDEFAQRHRESTVAGPVTRMGDIRPREITSGPIRLDAVDPDRNVQRFQGILRTENPSPEDR